MVGRRVFSFCRLRIFSRSLLDQGQYECGIFGQVAFPPKPVCHRLPELLERNVGTNLEISVGHRQGVVKNRSVREVAHAEIVEPLQRTELKLALLLVLHADFAGEHVLI